MATPDQQRNPRIKPHSSIPRHKTLFGFFSLQRLGGGCARISSPEVTVHSSVPETRRSNNNKKQRRRRNNNRGSCPENVCCTPPGIGFTYDVAQSTTSDAHHRRRNHSQRSRATTRQPTDLHLLQQQQQQQPAGTSFDDTPTSTRSNVSDHPRQYNRLLLQRPSPGQPISEVVMIQHNQFLDGGSLEGSDRFGAWRINADLMSYEELVELSDRIGYVDGGLQEEEILDCLKRPKKSLFMSFDFSSKVKDSKCSICQEECKGDEDLGRLDCGHYHHVDCIKQWLLRKNECPICKTVAKPNK